MIALARPRDRLDSLALVIDARPELRVRPRCSLVAVVDAGHARRLVVLSGRQPVINTLHVATGAVVLGTALVLTLRTYRVRFQK